MKKGYYLFPTYVKKNGELLFTGVMKKMDMQVKELSKSFNTEFKIIYAPDDYSDFSRRIVNRLFVFSSQKRLYDEVLEEINHPDFIYMRKVEADKDYMNFLRVLRERFKTAKIIIEIPTYPYEKEVYKSITSKINLIKDRIYRKKYKEYIDRIVIDTQDKYVFGVPTIHIMNGINVESQKIIGTKPEGFRDTINFIFIGIMQRQHGLERIIRGLKAYYSEKREVSVRFLFVGKGPEYDYYKKVALQQGVEGYISFYGNKSGEELDDICDCADIAISPLGCYKTLPLEIRSSALKTREYLSRGLPIITGCIEDVFELFPCDFHIDFANDDTTIEIEKIVMWYQDIINQYESREKLAFYIRKYASEHVDNSVTMKPIIEYIQGKNS